MQLDEIADQLGISVGAVTCYQKRGIEKIRKICLKYNITYEEFLSCLKYTQLF